MIDMMSFATSFLRLCALIGAGIVLILLQIWLSRRKSPLPGLAMILIACVVFLSLTFWAFHIEGQYQEEKLSCHLKNGMTAEAILHLDENKEILSVTAIFIKDKEGIKVDEVGWGEDRLKDLQNRLKGNYDITENTMPSYEDDMKHGVTVRGVTFNRSIFLFALVAINLPILCVYLYQRYQLRRKKRSEELARMNIQELV